MTLRVASSPDQVSIEQYGNAGVSRIEPTSTTTEGKAFSFDRGPLSIDGVVLNHDAQDAEVDINYIRWNGNNICSSGVCTFLAE